MADLSYAKHLLHMQSLLNNVGPGCKSVSLILCVRVYMLSNQKSIARPTNVFLQYVGYCCIGNKDFTNAAYYSFQIR